VTLTKISEATQACLFSVIDRFNTEDPFWSSFVPQPELTNLRDERFALTVGGKGVFVEIRGVMIRGRENPEQITPSIVVGAKTAASPTSPRTWHPITCALDSSGRFVTSNFRKAIEASIEALRA
jgi:hypothetical protein